MNVEDLLKRKQIPYIPKGADFVISCLNPEHPDRNPSMRVDQVTGIFNCFSCQYKGNLFKHFGEKVDPLQLRRQMLIRKIGEKRAESVAILPDQLHALCRKLEKYSSRNLQKF